MCNVKMSINIGSVKVVISVYNILEQMLFLHHNAKVFT
jgi:hypothetical protein